MGAIVFGILLAAVGGVVAFGIDVDQDIYGVDLQVIGVVALLAGVLIAALGIFLLGRKRTAVTSTVTTDASGHQAVTEQRSQMPPRDL